MARRKVKPTTRRVITQDVLRNSGIRKITSKKITNPYYSSTGRCLKGEMEIKDF